MQAVDMARAWTTKFYVLIIKKRSIINEVKLIETQLTKFAFQSIPFKWGEINWNSIN